MRQLRFVRNVVRRATAFILRGEITCTTAAFATVLSVFVLITLVNMSKSPTIMTTLDNMKIDFQQLQKDTSRTILIEQDDGEVFVAFRLKDSATILKDVRGGTVTLKYKSPTKRPSKPLNTTSTKHSSKNDTNNNKDRMNKEAEEIVVPTYPLTAFNNAYNLNNKRVCSDRESLSFVVLVHSATVHFMRRSSIRETWANHRLFTNHSIRIVFLLGKPEKESTQTLIEHESGLYKDIVQGNFVDSYKNLTHKGVLGLRWVTEYCPGAKLIIKVDDDVFLNVFKLFENIETQFKNKTKHIWCPVRQKGTSEIQRKSGKWKIEENVFKNMTHYPVTYCNGFFTILTNDIVPPMFKAASSTPFFWVDDVYLFGLLPDKVGGVKHENLQHLNLNEKDAIKCFESTEKKCPLLVANAHSDGIMDKLWFRALDQYKSLAKKYSTDLLFRDS